MENLSLNSYLLLKKTADEILKKYLEDRNESKDYFEFRKWIINEEIDKHNTKLPGQVVIEFYNYCINNFRK